MGPGTTTCMDTTGIAFAQLKIPSPTNPTRCLQVCFTETHSISAVQYIYIYIYETGRIHNCGCGPCHTNIHPNPNGNGTITFYCANAVKLALGAAMSLGIVSSF